MTGASIDPAGIGPGLSDPVFDSQTVFRALLDAMARPGSVHEIEITLTPPAPLPHAAAATLLSLSDHDTPIWLDDAANVPGVADYVRFHCGSRIVGAAETAAFALSLGGVPDLSLFAVGSDEYPETSATLIIEVPSLTAGSRLRLRGPGIDGSATIAAVGLDAAFCHAWAANNALFPRGIDVFLTSGDQVVALPRTTQIEE